MTDQPLSAQSGRHLAALAELDDLILSGAAATEIIYHCFDLVRDLQGDFAQAPETWMAQTQVVFSDDTYSRSPRLRPMLLAMLFSHCHRWHPQSSGGLICAAITLDVYSWPMASENFLRQLTRLDQQVWANILIPVARLLPLRKKAGFYQRFARLNHPQLLLMVVAMLCIPEQKNLRAGHWQRALRHLVKQLPTACYWVLEPIITSLSIIPENNMMQTQGPEKALVSHQHAAASALTVSSAQPLSKPPAKLLAIQDLLKQEDADVDVISTHIAAEGFLAKQLKTTASHRSRMNLHMQEVKHALLFQGFERTSSILVQQTLLNRLNQHYFPLQQHLLQFCLLLGHVLEALGDKQPRIQTESLITLGYFFCSGLFISTAIKRRTRLSRGGEKLYSLNHLLAVATGTPISRHSLTLARAWQQDKSSLEAIRCHHQFPQDSELSGITKMLATILGLGLMISRQIYFAQQPQQQFNNTYWQQALQSLKLRPEDVDKVITQALEKGQCYWPLR